MSKTLTIVLGLLAGSLILASSPAPALELPEDVELLAEDAQQGDFFGDAVALGANRALIGAWGVDDINGNAGGAYIFEREDGVWEQKAKLLPEEGVVGGAFGRAVALDGDTALIGAATGSSSFPGAAYVFTRADGGWTLQSKLVPDDSQDGDHFGGAVALDGDTALIGKPSDDTNGEDAGTAYVFVRTGGMWVQQDKLFPTDAAAGEGFGFGIDLEGSTAAIGATGNDGGTGAVYVFTRTSGVWTQQAKLLASDGVPGDGFGIDISLDGQNVLIGAGWADVAANASGAAYVFTLGGEGWVEEAKLAASDAVDLAWFGRDLALNGNVAVIGAEGDDAVGNQSGAAYVFSRAGGSWIEQAKLAGSDVESGDRFGSAVAFYGNTVIIGAYSHNHGLPVSGSAYVYRVFGDGSVPATRPVGAVLLLLGMLGAGAYFLRSRSGG